MDIVLFLSMTCFVFAIIGLVRAKMNRDEQADASGKRAIQLGNGFGVSSGDRVRRIDAHGLPHLMSSDSDLTVYHLVTGGPLSHREENTQGKLMVTLPQLEEALPWIPEGERIVIYEPNGLDPASIQRLLAITRGHEVVLVSGSTGEARVAHGEMGGEK